MTTNLPTGSRIRERRLAQGVRQAHLAAAVGVSASYLNLIEHNRRPIAGGLLVKLADALEVDHSDLSSEADDDLIEALRAAGAAQNLEADALAQAPDLARRFPAWARAVAGQANILAEQVRTIEALSDRLTHDPALAEAMHELLSTVSVVRSTASILAQTPEIDRNWLSRFHSNLDTDSRRLADGAEAVVSYLDQQTARGDARLTVAEVVARFLDDNRHYFPVLEDDPDAVGSLVAGIADAEARAHAATILTQDARDAARLPLATLQAAGEPEAALDAAGGDPAIVLRRFGVTDPARGLVIADAAGAMIRRKPVAGFALPIAGAGCPLWPIFEALSQPGRPLVRLIEMPDGAQWQAHAVATPIVAARFDETPPLRTTMLLTRAARPGAARPVGPGCRVCPRSACPARREPSLLSGASPVPAEAGHRPSEGGE